MSKLVVAKKPSVAQSLARVIGATKRQDGYLYRREIMGPVLHPQTGTIPLDDT